MVENTQELSEHVKELGYESISCTEDTFQVIIAIEYQRLGMVEIV